MKKFLTRFFPFGSGDDASGAFRFPAVMLTVKDPKGIYLSLLSKKSPKYKMRGKTVIVYFEEDLLPNTTYTLDLTGAIADNNEGNMFPGFTTVFSTGRLYRFNVHYRPCSRL